MSRKAHYNFPGVSQLITQKTNSNELCFFVDKDYQHYLCDLQALSDKYHCHIHAYALMPDAVCILATPYTDNGISHMMQELSQRHISYINTTYGQTGSLWNGGYKSCLVDSEQYLITCMRYVELGPVIANIVDKKEDYRWSSYHYNAFNKKDDVITAHPDYMDLADTEEHRLSEYKAVFEDQLSEDTLSEIRIAVENQQVLGPDTLKEKVEEIKNRRKLEEDCISCNTYI